MVFEFGCKGFLGVGRELLRGCVFQDVVGYRSATIGDGRCRGKGFHRWFRGAFWVLSV